MDFVTAYNVKKRMGAKSTAPVQASSTPEEHAEAHAPKNLMKKPSAVVQGILAQKMAKGGEVEVEPTLEDLLKDDSEFSLDDLADEPMEEKPTPRSILEKIMSRT